jgi:hypothetical protein
VRVKKYITVVPRGKRKKEWKNDEADNLKPRARCPAQAQSHGPALEAYTSYMRSKMRPATVKTSRADFRSWGMSWTCSMPRSTRALEIPMTSCDSRPASTARSPLIPSTRTRVSSSSTDRFHLLGGGGCRPRACSSASITSCTSRSISYRQRRIWYFSNVQLRSVSRLDMELVVRACAEKSS